MKLFKLEEHDKVFALFSMILSVVSIVLGVLVITKGLKLHDEFLINPNLFGRILLITGIVCLIYSMIETILVYKKFKKINRS